ncbi:hypothetical protein [Pseudomonas sp. GL-R-26]|uniref:hypothetical protein n=1 Tax=Pseudomonas sp. GL-R-26 TaxID=2832392 RepID=UPI001CBE27A5|nr:hypothetical protein [Pseudomonas sp. GL-R-26]
MDGFELRVGEIRYEGKGVLIHQVEKNYLGTSESPIVVHVDTDTDWPAIIPSGAGVVVALLVAWLTVRVQQNQIQGNISNFRNHWMSELRAAASELVMVMRVLSNAIVKKKDFKVTDEYYDYSSRMLQVLSRVELLLSRDDEHSDQIRALGNKIVRKVLVIDFRDPKHQEVLDDVTRFQNLVREELETAWAHTKEDLGINRKFLFLKIFGRLLK